MSLKIKLLALSLICMVATSANGNPMPNPDWNSETVDGASASELDVFRRVNLSIADAIKIAENRAAGGKVVDISFDGQSSVPVYRIKTYQSGRIWIGAVDAVTGCLIDDGVQQPLSTLDDIDRIELSDFDRARMSLLDVVAIAEQEVSGSAVSAGLAEDNGRFSFAVVVLADNRLLQVAVAPEKIHASNRGGRLN